MLFTLQFVVIRACLSKPNSNMECGSEALYTYNINVDIRTYEWKIRTSYPGQTKWWPHNTKGTKYQYCSDGGAIIVQMVVPLVFRWW